MRHQRVRPGGAVASALLAVVLLVTLGVASPARADQSGNVAVPTTGATLMSPTTAHETVFDPVRGTIYRIVVPHAACDVELVKVVKDWGLDDFGVRLSCDSATALIEPGYEVRAVLVFPVAADAKTAWISSASVVTSNFVKTANHGTIRLEVRPVIEPIPGTLAHVSSSSGGACAVWVEKHPRAGLKDHYQAVATCDQAVTLHGTVSLHVQRERRFAVRVPRDTRTVVWGPAQITSLHRDPSLRDLRVQTQQ